MKHTPVLLRECSEALAVRPDGVYVDGTLGYAGHAREIAKRLRTGRLIAIDRDESAIEAARAELHEFGNLVECVRGNFRDIKEILGERGIDNVDGMLFDFGVSSAQLDNAKRGFSYMHDAPLDMRMDNAGPLTAFEIVNGWSADELRRVFSDYGEERYSRRIAEAIAAKRGGKPIATTYELNSVILAAIPAAARREKQHPSKRCFQALRIAVNDELGAIDDMLEAAPDLLKRGGRLCVISFHSLEDKRVKAAFLSGADGCKCPKDFPVCVCGFTPKLKLIGKRPVTPAQDEIERNPRARSAKLRVAERL
ncbi:MAG: 16S rRNA (cytosine(1402)-N(4))-methyltransferase RsmH [Oscillospiraceae bacterium]|nr:16S rRNA (cytosine(1402)-N(4))-methyltransferase RsmH [Oscillospiraceae bacterium]